MNSILVFTYPFSAIYILAISLGLGAFLARKFRLGWRFYWIGAGTFILSQIGHIPFNAGLTALFRNGVLPSPPAGLLILFNVVLLGLSAGLFEEIARYACYRWWAKDARSWGKGLLMGAGHGGIEALLVGLLLIFVFIVMFALRGADLSGLVPEEQLPLAQEQIRTYWTATWYDSLLGAVERTFTLPAHLAFSILVLQVFLRRQSRWLWFAIGWHAFLDAAILFVAGTWSAYQAELVLGIFAILNIIIIFTLRKPEPEPDTVDTAGRFEIENLDFHMPAVEENLENLDRTRYQE